MQTIDCPGCIARAHGYVVPVDQDADYVETVRPWRRENSKGNDPPAYVLARGTSARLLPEQWLREIEDRKRPMIWKREHVLRVGTFSDWWRDAAHTHVTLRNSSHKRDHGYVFLCSAPEGMIGFDGPGADRHIAEDAERVAVVLAREDKAARDLARRKLLNAEADALSKQLEAALKALGFETANANTGLSFPSSRDDVVSPEAYRVSLRLPDVVRLVEALGSSVFRPQPLPPPLWKVWYGATKNEDKEPIYLAARNRAAVVAHMTATYVHEQRPGDEPDVPLKPELLIIEEAGPDPEVPEAEDKAKAKAI